MRPTSGDEMLVSFLNNSYTKEASERNYMHIMFSVEFHAHTEHTRETATGCNAEPIAKARPFSQVPR